jgi:hypothetical protein
MTQKTKGRTGWHQKAASNISFFIYPYFIDFFTHFKAFIVTLAVWGLIPIGWADWINHQEKKDG